MVGVLFSTSDRLINPGQKLAFSVSCSNASECIDSAWDIFPGIVQVVPFNLGSSDGSDLDTAMLAALLQNIPPMKLQTGLEASARFAVLLLLHAAVCLA